jgi:hypothetical protein
MLKAMEKNKGVRTKGGSISGGCIVQPPENTPRLKDLGIEKTQSMRWQQKALGKKNQFHDGTSSPSLG